MLKVKRTKDDLIFEVLPPFNDAFFAELRSTLNDFIKIGRKHFGFDYKHTEELDDESARKFEEIIPTIRKGGCKINVFNAPEAVALKLPG